LGILIGLERNFAHREPGMRTFSLITMGSALFVILGNTLVSQTGVDPTRIISQIATGIGFLGAGVIIFQDKKLQGLTTAAAIWIAAAIGAAVGLGAYLIAGFATALVVFILSVLWKLEDWLEIK
jgi:putative Mg2+ transporter-C (MgtC) family protein